MVFRVGVIGVGGHVFNHQSCYVSECTVRMIPLHILLISDRKRYVEIHDIHNYRRRRSFFYSWSFDACLGIRIFFQGLLP